MQFSEDPVCTMERPHMIYPLFISDGVLSNYSQQDVKVQDSTALHYSSRTSRINNV